MADQDYMAEIAVRRATQIGKDLTELRDAVRLLAPATPDGVRTQAEMIQNLGQAISNVNQVSLYVDEIV